MAVFSQKLKNFQINNNKTLSIKEDIDSSVVAETDTDRQEVLSNLIQK